MRSAIHTKLLVAIFIAAAAICASAQPGYRVTKRVTFKKGEVATTVARLIRRGEMLRRFFSLSPLKDDGLMQYFTAS